MNKRELYTKKKKLDSKVDEQTIGQVRILAKRCPASRDPFGLHMAQLFARRFLDRLLTLGNRSYVQPNTHLIYSTIFRTLI